MKRLISTLAAFTMTTPFALGAAHAQDDYPVGRSGATFGIGIGGGTISCGDEGCDDFEGSGSLDLHVGGMLSPGVAILFDAWWMLHDDDRFTVDQGILTAAVRAWPISNFWLQGGLGVARAGIKYDGTFFDAESRTEWVPAFQIGIGVEPIATDTFGLDVSLRYGTGFYSDGEDRIHNASLNVGVSFY